MRRWLRKVVGRLTAFARRDRAEPTSSSSATTRGPLATAVTSSAPPKFVYTVTELKVPKSPTTPNAHFPISSLSVHDFDKLPLPSQDEKNVFESTDAMTPAPKSRALLIGIHYTKHKNPDWPKLTTPGKDVKNIHTFLQKSGYTEFRILSDQPIQNLSIHAEPTRKHIIEGLSWLVQGARDGDRLFLHYSGHGHQVATDSCLESDGFDEAIVPLTRRGEETYILDDELADIVVKPLPAGCSLLALFDCCHSGTMLDLHHQFPLSRNLTPRFLQCYGRFGFSNRPKVFTRRYKAASTSMITPELPPKRKTDICRRGTVKNLLHLAYGEEILKEKEERRPSIALPRRGLARTSTDISYLSDKGLLGLDTNIRVSSPEPIIEIIQEETSLDQAAMRISGIIRSHTFGHYDSPSREEHPLTARVVAIAGCMDSENIFDLNDEGGLLTSTFIDCMSHENHRDGVQVRKMRQYLCEIFEAKTRKVHASCAPPDKDSQTCGNKHCKLPITPPNPLVTSTMFLAEELLIRV